MLGSNERGWRGLLTRLHRDEQGAEGLEKLLIVGAIVLPLLGVLLVFREKIAQLATDAWNNISGSATTAPPSP